MGDVAPLGNQLEISTAKIRSSLTMKTVVSEIVATAQCSMDLFVDGQGCSHAGFSFASTVSDNEQDIKAKSIPECIEAADANVSVKEDDDDSDDDDSDDSDSDDDNDEPQKRQRGRGRKGQQDTAKKIEETEAIEKVKSDNNNPSDDTTEKGKTRYCVGRKPVTDYTLGSSYPAEVVYVKPFGVFFDIGCHSDAFCHVSRLRDDFVESPETMFKEGDKVATVRVVEIDRRRKRITVSLQSESRAEDERKSIDARRTRT